MADTAATSNADDVAEWIQAVLLKTSRKLRRKANRGDATRRSRRSKLHSTEMI